MNRCEEQEASGLCHQYAICRECGCEFLPESDSPWEQTCPDCETDDDQEDD